MTKGQTLRVSSSELRLRELFAGGFGNPLRVPIMIAAGFLVAAAGCGIDEQVHNAALKDRDAQKQKLAESQNALEMFTDCSPSNLAVNSSGDKFVWKVSATVSHNFDATWQFADRSILH